MGAGKAWSAKDIETLNDLWGSKTPMQIAKTMGRSYNAIKVKSTRLKLGAFKDGGEYLNARHASELLGIDVHAVTDFWIPKKGLKAKKLSTGEGKRKTTYIKFDDLILWLEKNQDLWDSRRVELNALGLEPQWLIEKRKRDLEIPKRRAQKWTDIEDSRAIALFKRGLTYREISKQMHRSACAVEHRLGRLDVWGSGKYISESKKREEKSAKQENLSRKSAALQLAQLLLMRRNEIAFDGYWQKEMCVHWHDVLGCTAEESNCDTCTSFKRIPPQYCVRCGKTFFEREINKICAPCRKARKAAAFRKRAHFFERDD